MIFTLTFLEAKQENGVELEQVQMMPIIDLMVELGFDDERTHECTD